MRLHLVRHGHVENPGKVVYGRAAGWRLSAEGRRQAAAVAARLRGRPLRVVYTSPLERAVETAAVIAGAGQCPVVERDDLIETALGAHWEGLSWRDVKTERRAEWETYLYRPLDLTFLDEPFTALAERMARALREVAEAHQSGDVAVVSHGDPIKAGVLALMGGDLGRLHAIPVPTGGLVTLELDGGRVEVVERWSPGRRRPAEETLP